MYSPVWFRLLLLSLLVIFIDEGATQDTDRKTYHLKWRDVSNRVLTENLNLISKRLDYESQKVSYTKSLAAFLPRVSYNGNFVNNLELPVFVFQGQRIRVGADYNLQHTLQLNFPVFAGGSRWLSAFVQNNIHRSLESELANSRQEEVYKALQSYFQIILTDSLKKSSREAVDVASANLEQVRNFHEAGTATNLDLQRARAQYYSKLPQLEAAISNHRLARQQIKLQLQIDLNDSLVIEDRLEKISILGVLARASTDSLMSLALDNRDDLGALQSRSKAAANREKIVYSRFFPDLTLSAGVDHQAQVNSLDFSPSAYRRSKTLSLSARWQLFDAGQRFLDAQKAHISSKQARIRILQMKDQVAFQVEQAKLSYQEAARNLNSLEQTVVQARESLRLAEAFYQEGAGSQLEVLDAQLFYTQSQIEHLRGIYEFNLSQLTLLKATGKMNMIWE
jgi:outer membrane protein TolC